MKFHHRRHFNQRQSLRNLLYVGHSSFKTKTTVGELIPAGLQGASGAEVGTPVSPEAPVPPEQRQTVGELLPAGLQEASGALVGTRVTPDAPVPPEQRQLHGVLP